MATNEELEQKIKELESLIVAQYDPPTGPEYSFPVPGQPIDQDQFQLLSLTDGNGIIDRGDYPYWLGGWGSDSETNQKNSMILKTGGLGKAEAVIGGYYHVLNENKTIPLPAVTETTTYYICLTFDPRYIEETGELANQSVSVQVYDEDPPTTFGRIHIVLYTVTRKPNQLLTDADVERFRPRGAPSISVLYREHLPKPSSTLFGSIGVLYGENDIVVARGASAEEGGPNRWDSIVDPPWNSVNDGTDYGWPGHGYKRGYRKIGKTAELRGRISRVTGKDFVVGGGNATAGYKVFNLPAEYAPKREVREIRASNSYSGNKLVVITIDTDGSVYMTPILGNISWFDFGNLRYSLED